MDYSVIFDPVYIVVLVLSVVVVVGVHFLISRASGNAPAVEAPNQGEANRRPANRVDRQQEIGEDEDDDDSSSDEDVQGVNRAMPKMMGKKKRAKMERKAAMKQYRQYQLEQSKERQVEEKKRLKELRKSERAAEKDQAAEDEAWEKYLEEKRQREEDEYQSWKPSMSVQECGSGDSARAFLERQSDLIISVIQRQRSVVLESLSARFDTTTAMMVDLLTKLVDEGRLEGIFDEHGKFIYVTREDRLKLAKVIQRRGRVGMGELTREANALISIDPQLEPEPSSSAVSDPELASSSNSPS